MDLVTYNSNNILNMQYKKGDTDYGRGYNAAVRKCNRRALRMAKRMVKAIQESMYDSEED